MYQLAYDCTLKLGSLAYGHVHFLHAAELNRYPFAFVAPFFVNCISEQDLDEMNVELIRNTLYKVTLSNSLLILLE